LAAVFVEHHDWLRDVSVGQHGPSFGVEVETSVAAPNAVNRLASRNVDHSLDLESLGDEFGRAFSGWIDHFNASVRSGAVSRQTAEIIVDGLRGIAEIVNSDDTRDPDVDADVLAQQFAVAPGAQAFTRWCPPIKNKRVPLCRHKGRINCPDGYGMCWPVLKRVGWNWNEGLFVYYECNCVSWVKIAALAVAVLALIWLLPGPTAAAIRAIAQAATKAAKNPPPKKALPPNIGP